MSPESTQADVVMPGARPSQAELLRTSLWLGCIGFGGGISVLSNIRTSAVVKRRWLTETEFDNTATVAQMLPGGAASNTLAYIGLRFHGTPGAALAYLAFIFPGMVSVLALAWAYMRFGVTPHTAAILAGVNAGVVGIITAITWKMVRTSVARLWQMSVATGALLLSLVGGASSGEVVLIGIAAGLIVDEGVQRANLLQKRLGHRPAPAVALPEEGRVLGEKSPPLGKTSTLMVPVVVAVMAASVGSTTQLGVDLMRMGLVFVRTGLGAYGGGFAILPHLHEAMRVNHWLTNREFAAAVAVGKLTPGPILLMATFIGYLLHGWSGAFVATVGIFLAPFALVVVLATWLDRVRGHRWISAAMRGLTPAVVGLMAAAGLTLGRSLDGGVDVAIAASVALTLGRFDLNPALVLALCGAGRFAILHFGHM